MSAALPTGLVLLAVHGNPGFPKDFGPLFREEALKGFQTQAIAAEEALLETSLRASAREETVLVGYSWGAYLVLKTLLDQPTLQPRHVVLIAPFLAPKEALGGFASLLMKTPFVSDAIVKSSWKKWKAEFVPRVFHEKDLHAGSDYLKRLEDPKVWQDVIRRKLLQEAQPLPRAKVPETKIHVVFAENDRITDVSETENTLRSLGLGFDVTRIPGAEHGLLWTHPAALAHEIRRLVIENAPKGSTP
jgi:pimeloyl-ACP methyl ester carboxylesterase